MSLKSILAGVCVAASVALGEYAGLSWIDIPLLLFLVVLIISDSPVIVSRGVRFLSSLMLPVVVISIALVAIAKGEYAGIIPTSKLLISFVSFYVAAILAGGKIGVGRSMAIGFLIGGAIQLAIGTYEYVILDQQRVTALVPNANQLGILVVLASLCILLLRRASGALYLLMALIVGWASVITGSRKLVVVVLIYGAVSALRIKNRAVKLAVIAALSGALALAVGLADVLLTYLQEGSGLSRMLAIFSSAGDGGSADERIWLAQEAWRSIVERPFFGAGLGASTSLNSMGLYFHDNYLEILASVGIIGFIAYYGALFWWYLVCAAGITDVDELTKIRLIFFVVLVLDFAAVTYEQRALFLLLGIAVSTPLLCRGKNANSSGN